MLLVYNGLVGVNRKLRGSFTLEVEDTKLIDDMYTFCSSNMKKESSIQVNNTNVVFACSLATYFSFIPLLEDYLSNLGINLEVQFD